MVDEEKSVKPVSLGEEVAPAKNWKLEIVSQSVRQSVKVTEVSTLTGEEQRLALLRPCH